jgi:hypothetical protein
VARLRRDIGVAATLAAAAIAIVGCGGSGTRTVTRTGPAATPAHSQAHGPRVAADCRLGGFLHALRTLESHLTVGLSYEQYFAEVKRAKSAYAAVPVAKLELPCLVAAGTPGERALNEYIEAANIWRECRADVNCGTYTIEPRLQRKWRAASHYLALVSTG